MKKNQIILIGILATLFLLFLMLVYKSDKNNDFTGESKISIYVASGTTLRDSDSLLQLIDVYSASGVNSPVAFTQTSLDVYSNGSPQDVSCSPSGISKLRNFFSSGFYTREDRISDIQEMRQNPANYSNILKSTTSPVPIADISINLADKNFYFKSLKDSINKLLSGQKKNITIVISSVGDQDDVSNEEEDLTNVNIDNPVEIGDNGGKGGKSDENGGDNGGGKGDENGGGDKGGGCKKRNVSASEITFEPGLPNVFSWIEDEGMTYDFSLKCTVGNCDTGLNVSKTNVSGGQVEVRASYEESTEKKYTATLVIKCGGKVLKTLTKTVKIVCA
jgi:hypothetical protein